MHRIFTTFFKSLFVSLMFLAPPKEGRSQEATYLWKNAPIGGGGFVSAIIHSKTENGLVYARTDVGGAYRWDASTSSWVSLLDWVSDDEVGYLGVESLAVDPQSPNKVYILVGISYFNNGKTAILSSDDYGGPGNGQFVVGDMNVFGRVYMSTARRGIIYGEPEGASPVDPSIDPPVVSSVKSDDELSFVIYPNPASDRKFTVILPVINGMATVSIFDGQGRLLYQKYTDGNKKLELDQRLIKGVYLVRL